MYNKKRKKYNLSKIWLHIFLRNIYQNVLLIENADNEQSNLFIDSSNTSKGRKPIENILNIFKSNASPIKCSRFERTPELTPEARPNLPAFYTLNWTRTRIRISKRKITLLKLSENNVDEIRNEEKYINNKIFKEYLNIIIRNF